MSKLQTHTFREPFPLEAGGVLPELTLAYHTFGELNASKSNVIWVFHALTANSDAQIWWPGFVGPNCCIDTLKYFVVCVNTIGSCYGSTGPLATNPQTGELYGMDFPFFTPKDCARSQLLLANHLGIHTIELLIGGSFGGYQALEFALEFQGQINKMVLIATAAKESPWAIAIHQSQRLALLADSSLHEKTTKAGAQGLKAARAIGMLTYRTAASYNTTQLTNDARYSDFAAASYISYQAQKLVNRFHAACYWHLLNCLDAHNIGRDRGSVEAALKSITIETLVIGITTDMLALIEQQKQLAAALPKATYAEIDSHLGHDGFLTEIQQLTSIISPFLTSKKVSINL